MNKLIAVGAVAVGGVLAFRALPQDARSRLAAALKRWMHEHMQQMMAKLPENAPPRLVMSVLPKLQAQNDQIIAMLRAHNELLREMRQQSAPRRVDP